MALSIFFFKNLFEEGEGDGEGEESSLSENLLCWYSNFPKCNLLFSNISFCLFIFFSKLAIHFDFSSTLSQTIITEKLFNPESLNAFFIS